MDRGSLLLPVNVSGRSDVTRLLRELESVDEFMQQAGIRTPGTSNSPPKSSRLFDELVTANKLNMLMPEDRSKLRGFLISVRAKGPVMHMSFSADPSPMFMQRLVTYLRREIHPLVLVDTGLQPTIGAGCMVRTTNKYFDFSLRKRFAAKRGLLLAKVHDDISRRTHAPPEVRG